MPLPTIKTGTFAILKAVERICINLEKRQNALFAVIDAAVVAGAITADQAAALKAALLAVHATCDTMKAVGLFQENR